MSPTSYRTAPPRDIILALFLISLIIIIQDFEKSKRYFKKSKNILIVAGIVLTIAAEILSMPLVRIFVNYDKELLLMTVRGFRLFSFSFLIMGINIWASSFFTALNNGFVSAAISFLRTFLFQVAAVCFLPLIIGIDGVWTSVLAAETMALAVTIIFLIKEKKKYRY